AAKVGVPARADAMLARKREAQTFEMTLIWLRRPEHRHYRMRNVKAMYRRGDILARTISEMFARADFGSHPANVWRIPCVQLLELRSDQLTRALLAIDWRCFFCDKRAFSLPECRGTARRGQSPHRCRSRTCRMVSPASDSDIRERPPHIRRVWIERVDRS